MIPLSLIFVKIDLFVNDKVKLKNRIRQSNSFMPDRLFSSNNKSAEDVKPVKYFFPYSVSSYKESPHDYTISSKIGKVAKNIPIALFLFFINWQNLYSMEYSPSKSLQK